MQEERGCTRADLLEPGLRLGVALLQVGFDTGRIRWMTPRPQGPTRRVVWMTPQPQGCP